MRISAPTSRTKLRLKLNSYDAFLAVCAPFVALALRDPALLDPSGFPAHVPETYVYAFVSILCAFASFLFFRLSDSMSRFFSIHDAFAICGAVACTVAASSSTLFVFTRLDGVPRSTPLIFGLVLGCGLISTRIAARALYREFKSSRDMTNAPTTPASPDLRRIILIGVDRFAAVAIKLTEYQKPRTTQVIAALDQRTSNVGRKISGIKIVGLADDLEAVIKEYAVHGVDIHEVWLSDDAPLPLEVIDRIGAQCASLGLPFQRLSEAFNLAPPCAQPPSTLAGDEQFNGYMEFKRFFDVVAAAGLLIGLAPIAFLVASVTFYDVGAPTLFWQQRVGRNGRKFLLYKFRTYHAPFDGTGRFIPEAQRLSKIGRFIRASRLDEIPQLFNVLIGDMSLIGPRPLLPHDQPSDPRLRLLVRPGVTGWAQINGGTIVTPEEKDALDVWYIRNASFYLDLKILVNTVLFALTGEKINQNAIEEAISLRQREMEYPQAAE